MKKLLTMMALLVTGTAALAQGGPQIYNMDFDVWSRSGGAWNLYPEDAAEAQKVWDTANHGMSLLGINGTTPEYRHLAVAGQGKAACRIESKKILWAFVAGNLYNGWFGRIVKFSGAELHFGVPFTDRPKRFTGYYHYIPKTVNYAKAPYLSMKGKEDEGRIELILTDWAEPLTIVTNNETFPAGETNPHVIGRAVIDLQGATEGYVRFDIPIEYRSDKTPAYVLITATSSRYGAFFTGADGSVLYIDEFSFTY